MRLMFVSGEFSSGILDQIWLEYDDFTALKMDLCTTQKQQHEP